MERIQKRFGKHAKKTARGQECHVSDVLGCEVKAYCRMKGLPRKMTKQSIGLMIFGIIAQKILQWTYPREWTEYESTIDAISEEETVFGHIDVHEEMKYPLEVKASRKKVFKRSQIPEYWLKQLISYMAMEGADKGWIIIFNVLSCQIMAFQVRMTASERLDQLALLTSKAARIKKSVKEDSPNILQIDPTNYPYCYYKNSCPRVKECFEKWKERKKKKSPLD